MRRRLPAPAWKRCFAFILLERRESMNISSKDVYRTLLKDYPDIMSIEEMSAALGVSTKTAYKLLREGKITAIKVGRAYRIPKIHLLAYLSVLNHS